MKVKGENVFSCPNPRCFSHGCQGTHCSLLRQELAATELRTTREVRLQELGLRLVKGTMTETGHEEYDALQREQALELQQAIMAIARREVGLQARIKRFLRRKRR